MNSLTKWEIEEYDKESIIRGGWDIEEPTQKEKALEKFLEISKLISINAMDYDNIIFSPKEMSDLAEIFGAVRDRIDRGIVGGNEIISDERNKTIDKITKDL